MRTTEGRAESVPPSPPSSERPQVAVDACDQGSLPADLSLGPSLPHQFDGASVSTGPRGGCGERIQVSWRRVARGFERLLEFLNRRRVTLLIGVNAAEVKMREWIGRASLDCAQV